LAELVGQHPEDVYVLGLVSVPGHGPAEGVPVVGVEVDNAASGSFHGCRGYTSGLLTTSQLRRFSRQEVLGHLPRLTGLAKESGRDAERYFWWLYGRHQ
jgi:hypothetical protein